LNHLTVLHINKFHHIIGGAEAIYFRTADILERYGHRSIFFAMKHLNNLPCKTSEYFMPLIDIDKERNVIKYLRASLRMLYSFKARECISKLLDRYPVDIVHMHDIHRQMSPSVLHETGKRRIPTVMTLHNYRMICPSFLMMADGKPCEACAQGRFFNALRKRCVKGSFFRSALISMESYLHHRILDIYKDVDIFIAPSMFLKNKHEEMGFKKKMVHLPYPLDIEEFGNINVGSTVKKKNNQLSAVYFGRLEPEKGLYTLTKAFRILSDSERGKRILLKIIGDGPIKEELKEMAQKYRINIRFPGFLKGKKLHNELRNTDFIIIPSEWYENYPVSVMEAFALGKPVIGARIGGIPEMVKDHKTGLTFESGNAVDLSNKIKYLLDNPHVIPLWGQNARRFIEQEVNPERHYQQLMEIYRQAFALRGISVNFETIP